MIRWHTDPQVPPPTPKEKELSDIVDSNSYGPLYLDIQSKINDPVGLDKEDVDWLQSIVSAFDVYVTQILHAIRLEPWDYEHRIRDEYTKIYGQPLPWDVSIRTVIGRLLTYKEIWSYQKEAEAKNIQRQCGGTDWFWRRPEPKPIWNVGCLSNPAPEGRGLISSGGELQLLTNINPKNRRQVYHVTNNRPWGLEIDPAHNWGVFIDQTRSYNSDAPIRVLMACCGEHVGATEGCWIVLKDDNKAVEGVIKPYEVYVDVFDTIWTDISNNSPSPIPSAAAIAESFRVGTAFQDVEKYEALHQRIKKALQNAAPVIRTAYEGYQTKLQTTLDTLDEAGDAKRDTNPFESILTKEEQEIILLPIHLKREYNAIQCIDTRSEPPTLQDYVNERVFKVQDMLREFTFEKMGGIEVTLKDETTTRIKMLKTQELESVEILVTLVKTINDMKRGPKRRYFRRVKDAIEQIIRRNIYLNYEEEKQRYTRVKILLEKFDKLNRKETLIPKGYEFSWEYMTNNMKKREQIIPMIENKQMEINTVLRSLRSNDQNTWKTIDDNLISINSLIPTKEEKEYEKEFEENMDEAILEKELDEFTGPQKTLGADALPFIIALYDEFKVLSENAIIETPPIVYSRFAKVNVSKKVDKARKRFDKRWKELTEIIRLSLIEFLLHMTELVIINEADTSDAVKQKIVLKRKYAEAITDGKDDIDDLEEDKKDIQEEFQKVIDEKTTKYAAKQVKLKEDALKTVQDLPADLVVADTPAKVRENVAKILGVVEGLNVYDEWDQKAFGFDKRVRELLDQTPTNDNVFTVKGSKEAYVAKWNEANGLMGAANALAAALAYLLQNLEDNNAAKEVNDILNGAENQAAEASKLIESKEVKEKRETDEKRERNSRKDMLKEVYGWLNTNDKQTLLKTSLTALGKLLTYIDVTVGSDMSYTNFYIGLKDTLGFSDNYFLFKKTPITGEELSIGKWEDQKTFAGGETELYKSLYLENATDTDMTIIKETHKAFLNTLVNFGLSVEKTQEDDFNDIFIKYKEVLAKPALAQPVAWTTDYTSTKNTVVTSGVKDAFPQQKMYSTENMISQSYLKWTDQSCWMDSALVSLFSIPETTLTNRIFETKSINIPQIALIFDDGSRVVFNNPKETCSPAKLLDLHTSVLEDINDIQNPNAGAKEYCRSKSRWSLDYGCVSNPADKSQDDPSLVFESLVNLYSLNDVLSINTIPLTSHIVQIPSSTKTTIYAKSIPSKRSIPEPDVFKTSFTVWEVPFKTSGYTLSALIMYSGGHYNAFVHDFAQKKWMFIDNNAHTTEWKDQLPEDIFNQNRSFALSWVIYFSDAEVARLVNLHKQTQKAPIPKSIWTSDFDVLDLKTIRKTLSESYQLSANPKKKDYATALNLLPNFKIPEVARASPLRYAYAQFNAWLQDAQELTEIRMRKAMAVAQVSKEDDSQLDLSPLGIVRLPDDATHHFYVKELLRQRFRDDDHRERTKRIYAVRYQIDFSKLEK